MGKLLVLSIYTEQVANEISLTGNYDKSLIQDVLNEIIILLKSDKKMQSIDEFRKILSILSMGGIVHNSTPIYIIKDAYKILINSFGKNNKTDIDAVFKGISYNQNYRSFIIVFLKDHIVYASGIVIEHQIKAKNKRINTWELQWVSSLQKNKGYGSKLWKLLVNLASKRRIDGILVPATQKALPFWLKQNSDLCPINETILLDNDSKETISIVKKFGYKIKNRPCKNLSALYSINKSNTPMFKVNPYKWSIKDTIHIWFLPKQYPDEINHSLIKSNFL